MSADARFPPKASFWDEQKVDEWNPPDCDPINDCISGFNGYGLF